MINKADGNNEITLDENGRCCGRKPLVYKRPHRLFCCRCNRQFSPEGKQQENWAYKFDGEKFNTTLIKDLGEIGKTNDRSDETGGVRCN